MGSTPTPRELRIEVRTMKHEGTVRRSWNRVMEEARRAGLDLSREFRVLLSEGQGFVEFWQEPLSLVTVPGVCASRSEPKKKTKKAKRSRAA